MTTDPASGMSGAPVAPESSSFVLALDAATVIGTAALLRGAVVHAECEVAMRGDLFVSEIVLHADGTVAVDGGVELLPAPAATERSQASAARLVGPGCAIADHPRARGAGRVLQGVQGMAGGALPVVLAAWEPTYGRLAEAQVKWEATHGRTLSGG